MAEDKPLYNIYDYEIASSEFTVIPNSTPNLTVVKLSEEEINRLGDGYSYTVQSFLKLITTENHVKNWGYNFRIGVFNNAIHKNVHISTYTDEEGVEQEIITDTTDYDNLTINELFENADYWSGPLSEVNTFENIECNFMYDEDYPVYIIFTGDFLEGDILGSNLVFTEPCIVETNVYKERLPNGIYPEPILNVLADDDTATFQLESYTQTDSWVVYEFPVDEEFGTNEHLAIRGVEIKGNIEQADSLVLYARLRSPTGEIGTRSIIISDTDASNDGDVNFRLGGAGDLWGFGLLELINMNAWSIELFASNILEDRVADMNFNNVQVTFYTESVDPQNIDIFVESENLSFYNCFFTDIAIPPGLETDLDILTVNGADVNDAYRQNIREKTIEIELEIGDSCDIELNTNSLRQLMKLLTNERDEYNRPIPKRIEFSHMPDVYFEYVMKDSPDVSLNINTYAVKIKLVVPDGTSYAKNSTITNTIGYIQGLAGVSPIINFIPTGDHIEILEVNSKQKFTMTYNPDWVGKIVEIDCEDMIVWLKESNTDTNPVNITGFCDYNVDWFKLHGEYNFEGTNCVIRTVDYTERW